MSAQCLRRKSFAYAQRQAVQSGRVAMRRSSRGRARPWCQFDDRIDKTRLLGMMHASRQQRRGITRRPSAAKTCACNSRRRSGGKRLLDADARQFVPEAQRFLSPMSTPFRHSSRLPSIAMAPGP
jgi:hypothetical protein